jgi:hypothetical protein
MTENFAAIILGGTGQVGGATVAELLAIPECQEVVMVTRKPVAARSRVRNVVLDTGAADFAERTAAVARGVLSQGPASAVSCVGSGSGRWSEEELHRLELGVVGAFARGCYDAVDTHFVVYMNAKDSTPSQELHSRGELAPVFADLNKYDSTMHFVGQSTIYTLTGDGATGEAYCLAHHHTVEGDKRRLMVAYLRYHDTFVKADGAWLFAERLLYVDWIEERAL